MHIILLNSVAGRGDAPTKIHELHFDARAQDESPANAIDLVVVDAREMDVAALNASIVWVARLRNSQSVRKAVMICRKPPIEFVVRAIRAGINDIFERPLSGRQVFLLLARGQTDAAARRAARAIMLCGYLLETTEAARDTPSTMSILERERRIDDLQKQCAAEASRLEQVRETLHVRETDLLSRAQRLDDEFARMQTDADLALPARSQTSTTNAPSSLVPAGDSDEHARLRAAEAQLRERAAQLDKRENTLATRDRMLREFEAMLLSQSQAAPHPTRL